MSSEKLRPETSRDCKLNEPEPVAVVDGEVLVVKELILCGLSDLLPWMKNSCTVNSRDNF